MNPILIPCLLAISLLAYFFWMKYKKNKAIRNQEEEYHVELSDTIQKEYFDEYEKEEKKEKGL